MNLAGVVALQGGRAEHAAARIEKAIQLQPGNPGFHANLAQAYLALKRIEDARGAFLRAQKLDPRAPQFAVGAASCLAMLGSVAEAEQQLRGVLDRHPGYALGWVNLARAVKDLGRIEEAVGIYRRALELEPALADAHNGLGSALHALGRLDEAEHAYREHLALQPDSVMGHCNLASVLIDRGEFGEAAAVCQRALARAPGSAELHRLMGAAQTHQGRFTEALDAFQAAVDIEPANLRARWGYGYALVETGRSRAGLQWLEGVLERRPDAPEFRDSLSLVRLSLGDLQGGWEEYRWRAARLAFLAGNPELHLADELPGNLSGRTICLLREQGLGDELFFLRFAAVLKSLGAHITYQAQPKLATLLGRVTVLDRLIASNEPPPAADAVLLVGDLPRALGRYAASPLPSRISGLPQDGAMLTHALPLSLRVFFPELPPPLALPVLSGQIERIQERLRGLGPPPYMGVTWRAGTPPAEQRGSAWALHKEIGLEALGTAMRGANGSWIALQRNPAPGEIDKLALHAGAPLHDFSALNEDLEAMLALLAVLDDYVGVSNTNMHLRASLGRTARVLVPRPAEWRWMTAGDESPWFPGFRIYRQGSDGNWEKALERLRGALLAAHSPDKR